MKKILSIFLLGTFVISITGLVVADSKEIKGEVSILAKAEKPQPAPSPTPTQVLD
jgi:hypothetical protein